MRKEKTVLCVSCKIAFRVKEVDTKPFSDSYYEVYAGTNDEYENCAGEIAKVGSKEFVVYARNVDSDKTFKTLVAAVRAVAKGF